MKRIIHFIIILTIVACGSRSPQKNFTEESDQSINSWNFKRIEGTFLIFKNKKSINTNLYDLSYIETIRGDNNVPYFILSGRSCNDCDENMSIYIFSLQDTAKPISNLKRYTYPGKIYDWKENKLLFESRLFIGNCLNSNKKNMIWMQKTVENGSIDSVFFIVDIKNKLIERIIKGSTKEYLDYYEALKNCKEIKGIDTSSEP